mmetsp:Transcript_4942/g.14452  ORF Transcript_4942/g.14452 Transcript_4942/m.14452 type:complete len:479 (-) Transcript_4942:123-1559(-)
MARYAALRSVAASLALSHLFALAAAGGGSEAAVCGASSRQDCAGEETGLLQVARADGESGIPNKYTPYARQLYTIPDWLPVMEPEHYDLMERLGRNCSLSDPEREGCPFSGMNKDNIYNLFPGGKSACLCSSSPYYFQVKPGAADKLLLFFQGGGACWDQLSFALGLCTKSATPGGWNGLLNFTRDDNPYRDYTMIKVLYCSGDMHAGNTERPWGKHGETVQVRGYENTVAVLNWVLANFPQLSELRLAGDSAGSLGVQWWARRVLAKFPVREAKAVVIPDSFAGVLFPPCADGRTETYLFKVFNMCGDDALTPEEQEQCRSGKLLLGNMFQQTIETNPSAQFAMINSKDDIVQRLFAKVFELSAEHSLKGALMTGEQYYKQLNLLVQMWSENANYRVYLVDGTRHTYTQTEYVFVATPLSYCGKLGGHPLLIDWIPCGPPAPKRVVCLGKKVVVAPLLPPPRHAGTTYCDAKLMALQ